MGTTTSVGPLFTAPDLEKLLRDAHELACHSCYHRSCRQSSTNQFRADCARNRGTAAGLFNGLRLRNFSYPYGDVRFPAKSALALDYDSCRSIEPGINDSHADLAFLRATPIYSATPPGTIRRLIAQNREQGGWLIFYTHDVAPAPSPFGCTPEEFRSVLSLAIESRAEILNVAQVLQRIPRLQLSGSESQTSITQ
jgi:peptidoglycan/xylan/chitin deacetylase (PgdA/CDA1 family)